MKAPKIYLPFPAPPDASQRVNEWRRCLSDAVEQLRQAVTRVVSPPGTYPPDIIPDTPDATDDEFLDTTLDPKWTWENLSSPTPNVIATVGNSFLRLNHDASATGITSILQAAPSGDWVYRCKLQLGYAHTAAGNQSWGVTLTCNNPALRVFRIELVSAPAITSCVIRVSKWLANRSTFDNVPGGASFQLPLNAPVYLEIENSSSTITARWSLSGFDDFHVIAAVTHGNIEGGWTPDNIGLGMWADNNVEFVGVCDWFRRIS